MKKSLLLLPFLLLVGCAPTKTEQADDRVEPNPENTVIEPEPEYERVEYIAYQDCSVVHTDNLLIQMYDFYCADFTSQAGVYQVRFSLWLKNISDQPVKVDITNISVVNKESKQSFSLRTLHETSFTIDSGRRDFIQVFNEILEPLSEDCYFDFSTKTVEYKMFFVNKPDELRRDVTVAYQLDTGEVVNTITVKEGKPTILNYVYDSDDHQTYANEWKDETGIIYQYDTPIEDDVILYGTEKECFEYSGGGSYVSRLCHVPEDGKVVVINKYHSDNFCIAPSAFSNTSGMVELYLPRELKIICDYNFRSSKPQIVYFEGSEEEWNAVRLDCGSFPSSVQIFFNASYFD